MGFHTFVLKRISSVFKDILEGDSLCSEIELVGVHPDFLEVLQYIIYSPPGERNADGLKKNGKKKGSRMAECHTCYSTVNTLITKYDIKLLLPVAASVYGDWVIFFEGREKQALLRFGKMARNLKKCLMI